MDTRIGVLSDTHIQDPQESLPEPLLEDFRSVSLILHAGDWVDLCVLEQLRPLAEVVGVCGNMDNSSVRYNLPEIEELEVLGYKIGLTHGWGPSGGIEKRILTRFPHTPDLIVFGHTHQPCLKKDGDLVYFNPGSPTDQVFAERRTYGIITLGERLDARIIEIHSP